MKRLMEKKMPDLPMGHRVFMVRMLTDVPPAIQSLWVQSGSELVIDDERFKDYLEVASHGEAVLARFLASVWLNRNAYDLDLIREISTLDRKYRLMIADWIKDPIWP
jgi:hypothetical protein